MAKSFQDIRIGDKAEFSVNITEELHNSFSKLSGDFSVIHTDESFSKRIGYAFLLTSFLSRLYGEVLPGGTSICIKQDVQFIKPYYIGDIVKVAAEVVGKIESTRFVEIDVTMFRTNVEIILRGKGVVQVKFSPHEVTPLYEADGVILYQKDFTNALKALGVAREDLLFVHSDITAFGKLLCFDRNLLCQTLIDALLDSTETIIMPTFTYSFCNGEAYDQKHSPSTVGTLTEYFRKMAGVVRSLHPIFSVAISGNPELANVGKDSFGKDSIFGKLAEHKGKLLFLGAPFQSCTFIHYVEQLHGIPYRYMKTFSGTIKTADKEYHDETTFFVRDLERNVNLDLTRFENYLLDREIMKQAQVGRGRILLVTAEDLAREGNKQLDEDIFYFLS